MVPVIHQVLEFDPAVVEGVEHLDSCHRILQALRSEQGSPSLAGDRFGPHRTTKNFVYPHSRPTQAGSGKAAERQALASVSGEHVLAAIPLKRLSAKR